MMRNSLETGDEMDHSPTFPPEKGATARTAHADDLMVRHNASRLRRPSLIMSATGGPTVPLLAHLLHPLMQS